MDDKSNYNEYYPIGGRMKFKKQLTITNWDEFQRLAQEARAEGIPLQTADGLLNPEVFDGWQFEFDLTDREDLA